MKQAFLIGQTESRSGIAEGRFGGDGSLPRCFDIRLEPPGHRSRADRGRRKDDYFCSALLQPRNQTGKLMPIIRQRNGPA